MQRSESMAIIPGGNRDAIAFPRSVYKIRRVFSEVDVAQSCKTKKQNYWLRTQADGGPKYQPRSTSGYGTFGNIYDTYWYDRKYYNEWPAYYYSAKPQYRKGTYEYPYSKWWYTAGPLVYPTVTGRSQAVDYLDPIFTLSYGSSRPWFRTKREGFPKLPNLDNALRYHGKGYTGAVTMNRYWVCPMTHETKFWRSTHTRYPHYFY